MTRASSIDGPLALVLSGGNALGGYQAGVYQALHAAGATPTWILGASIGAANAALIAGNAPDRRVEALDRFWRPGMDATGAGPLDTWRRTLATQWTIAAGRPDVFVPRAFGFSPDAPASLFDTSPLGAALMRLVDFGRLNAGEPRVTATAVDLETGDDVAFDTAIAPITADHLRASAALIPVFQPVKIDGRLLGDAGLSANLPLDMVLREASAQPLLCIAVDLLPLAAPRPRTLTEVADRMQDLIFSTQSRRTIDAWRTIFDLRARHEPAPPSVTLIHLVYADQAREVVGKAFDFSPASVRHRWDAGLADMRRVLAMLENGEIATGAPGLTVHRFGGAPA